MGTPIAGYLSRIEAHLSRGDATEHTYRPALEGLLEGLIPRVVATNEPKRIACGAPDFIVTRADAPLGYVEAKDVGTNLDREERSEQLKRYRDSLGNLVLTDYLEFRWYVEGESRQTVRLARQTTRGKLQRTVDGAAGLMEMLASFEATLVPTVRTPRELAQRMAHLARLIRTALELALGEEIEGGTLHAQLDGFREVLLHDLDVPRFSDMYAQTIAYGLFAARCNHRGSEPFSRRSAAFDIPATNPFLQSMFGHIAGPQLDDRVAWAVDALAELLQRADVESVLADFGKRTRQEDPVVHFYETFLAAYDPKMREARGVYYTPEPVVSYIVRSVDHILRDEFELGDGLADTTTVSPPSGLECHKVLILDPAAGTGTFLHGVVDHIHDHLTSRRQAGLWPGYVADHLLPRLFGFELLMAPYAVAHMKLGLQLAATGYTFGPGRRLNVFLTNTLEEAREYSGHGLFATAIAREGQEAVRVKRDSPVMVIVGNPPYSNYGRMNRNPWILRLLDDYKRGLHEKKLNLDDDFIKFIRFAQWRIEQTGYGVLGFITNNTYVDGITHRRMRESLMETFDTIYILNLHGDSRKAERCPDGSKDENVFDIQQGVAISIMVRSGPRSPGDECVVRYADLWGVREKWTERRDGPRVLTGGKYGWLAQHDVSSTRWRRLEPTRDEFQFFVPRARGGAREYGRLRPLSACVEVLGSGLKTDRNSLCIDLDRAVLERRMQTFFSGQYDDEFRDRYRLRATTSYDPETAAEGQSYDPGAIRRLLHRPFDERWIYYQRGFTSRPVFEVHGHLLEPNLALLVARQSKEPFAALASRLICTHKIVTVYDQTSAAPLYLYTPGNCLHGRRPNLRTDFIAEFAGKLGLSFVDDGRGDLTATFGPEDVFDYTYAVFYSPTYRSRYAELLKVDFPRVPLTSKPALFRDLCGLGRRLVELHVMDAHADVITGYPIPGDNSVDKIRYSEPAVGHPGRAWINDKQHFTGVAPEVWQFHIGGYQVCEKWLKDRKGRLLTYDDITHYQRVVAALAETIQLMSEIDEAIERHGGWPVE